MEFSRNLAGFSPRLSGMELLKVWFGAIDETFMQMGAKIWIKGQIRGLVEMVMVELGDLDVDPREMLWVSAARGERCDEREVVDLELADGERRDGRGVVELEFDGGARCDERVALGLEHDAEERCEERGVVDLEFPGGGVQVRGLSIGLLMFLVEGRCLDKHGVSDW